MKPGITVLVPAGADYMRPMTSYGLRITDVVWVKPTHAEVVGRVCRSDGSPSTLRHPYRRVSLALGSLTIMEVTTDPDTED